MHRGQTLIRRGGRSRDCPIVQYASSDDIHRTLSEHETHCSDSVANSALPVHVPVKDLETRPDIAEAMDRVRGRHAQFWWLKIRPAKGGLA
ncbi:hypothetical protein [Scleromatobacter humisilvae]|uniref:Uncharacterized protein n=1 Tax=Scleromatobacter humisilvae TaxID=2897159 RepID=A0A9X1YK78_9BURK|nr:hypothetical protein [Scleromatobacter humisilvae]MCK9686410.1 hypothetical protein [Scleromatobacter humisilvae]